MLEIEQKFQVTHVEAFQSRLGDSGAQAGSLERHADTYYRHPCRDFVQTGEAFRVRRLNEIAYVTYKGKKVAVSDETLKAREEIEWCLAPADADGLQMERLLTALGFEAVTTVRKQRVSYHWPEAHEYAGVTVTYDKVDEVGSFAEIERLVESSEHQTVGKAASQIASLAERLGLVDRVKASYLELLLTKRDL